MGMGKVKSEGGSGGKRGHSNMNHRNETEWVKKQAKLARRVNSKLEIAQEIKEISKQCK